MGASDLLIGAMAVHLAKIHGRDNFVLLTADRRMDAIFAKACPNLKENTAKRLGLLTASRNFGFGNWKPDIYPRVLNLQRAKLKDLEGKLGQWPLETKKIQGREPKA